jgi:putative transposase
MAFVAAPGPLPSTCRSPVPPFPPGKHLVTAGRPLVHADSGVENVNGAVDSILTTACLDRVLAQVEVAFFNSLIQAYWRSLKHQWLFLNTLDSVARVRTSVEFHVNEHNTKMPHPASGGQTPDEMFFGTGAKVTEKLALAKRNARTARLATNPAMSCERCLGQQAHPPQGPFPLQFPLGRSCEQEVQNVFVRSRAAPQRPCELRRAGDVWIERRPGGQTPTRPCSCGRCSRRCPYTACTRRRRTTT